VEFCDGPARAAGRHRLCVTEAQDQRDRLLVVAHQAVIMVFRYVLEELTEQELLEVDKEEQVANASLTRYDRDADGNLRLTSFNEVEHLETADEEVTEEPDAAPRH